MTGMAKVSGALAAVPSLGSGLGYRRELKDKIFSHAARLICWRLSQSSSWRSPSRPGTRAAM